MPSYTDLEVTARKFATMDHDKVIVTGRKKEGESNMYPKEPTVIVRIPTDWAAEAELAEQRKTLVIASHLDVKARVAEIETELKAKQVRLHEMRNLKNPNSDDMDRTAKLAEEVRQMEVQLETFAEEEKRQGIVARVLAGGQPEAIKAVVEGNDEEKQKQSFIDKALKAVKA